MGHYTVINFDEDLYKALVFYRLINISNITEITKWLLVHYIRLKLHYRTISAVR